MAMAEPSRSDTPGEAQSVPAPGPGPGPAQPGPAQPSPAGPRRSRLWLAWLVLAFGGLAVWFGGTLRSYGVTGASYAAHVGCSCRYIGGRSLASCRDDFEKGMGLVVLSEDADEKSVTARFPLLSTQTATYRAGQGCVLEAWKD